MIPSEIEVHIEERHIRNSVHSNCSTCPVALALKEELGKYGVKKVIKVFSAYIMVGNVRLNAPREVELFNYYFDMKFPMRPIKFRLNISELRY